MRKRKEEEEEEEEEDIVVGPTQGVTGTRPLIHWLKVVVILEPPR